LESRGGVERPKESTNDAERIATERASHQRADDSALAREKQEATQRLLERFKEEKRREWDERAKEREKRRKRKAEADYA